MKKSTLSKSTNSFKPTSNQSQQKSQIILKEAIQKHEKGQYQSAIQLYKKSIQLNPNKASTHFNLSLVYKNKKKYMQELKCLQEAIKIDPNYIQVFINLGNLYKKVKKYQDAQKSYKIAIQKDPNQINALTNLGLLYKFLKKFQLSQQIFKKIIQKAPNNSSAYNNLAVILKNRKKYEQAFQCWKKAIEIDSKFVQAYYNLGSFQSILKQFEEAQAHLKIADSLKPNDPIILIARAVNLSKIKKHDESLQLIQKLNQIFLIEDLQSIEKRTTLTKGNLEWIKSSVTELQMLQNLNKQQMRMSEKQKQLLSDINDEYMKSFINAQNNQEKNQYHIGFKKRLQNLENQLKTQKNQIISVNKKVSQIEQQINELKSYFEWDKQFDKLLEQQPKLAPYYRSLYVILSTSIQSYRAVQTGIVSGGEQIIKSKVGSFVQKITKILKIAEVVPMISHFCTAVVSIGQIYLGKQSQHVVNQIVGATNTLFNEKKLAKATNQTILYLSRSQQFLQILKNQKSNKIWYEQLYKKAKKIETKLLQKSSGFGGHNNITDEMNIAMGHCAEIIIAMIRFQNSKIVSNSQNPLLEGAKFWLKERQLLTLNVLGAIIQVKQGFFVQKIKPYCIILYKNSIFQTQVQKKFLQTPRWTQNIFKLGINKKQKLENQIKFQLYDKSLFKDSLIGIGSFSHHIQKQKKYSIQLYNQQQLQIGYLQILFQ